MYLPVCFLALLCLCSSAISTRPLNGADVVANATVATLGFSPKYFGGHALKRSTFEFTFPEVMSFDQPTVAPAAQGPLRERGLASWLWAGTRLLMATNAWSAGLAAIGIACTASSYIWEQIPAAVSHTCNAITLASSAMAIFGTASNRWDALQKAKREGTYGQALMELPFYDSKKTQRRDLETSEAVAAYIADLERMAIDRVVNGGEGYVWHDPTDNYAVVPINHVFGATESEPVYVGLSYQGVMIVAGSKLWIQKDNATGMPTMVASSMSLGLKSNEPIEKRLSCTGQACCRNEVDISYGTSGAKYQLCDPFTKSDGESDMYYGEMYYGDDNQWEQTDGDIGALFADHNGAVPLWSYAADHMANENAWQACTCIQEDNVWVSTGDRKSVV